ncbi:type II toxin-antitoxin system HicB family antitoxin [Falsiroseomonas sp.]|uniref:type II toxin-antitoxin system HicB family antitoxin n=1 Tax=Falsiroseomonas sp. TaxID=2870721 RepID=UPI0034A45D78
MADYIALIHKEPTSDYGVSFPDFPGCVTAGTTLDEARREAAEGLAMHIDGMIEDGEAIPEPSLLEDVMAERENREAVAFLVPAPARQVRAVRVNITLPEDVLADVDRFAGRQGLSRSSFLARAARRAMSDAA